MAEQPIATQEWHTRAIVRMLETVTVRSVDPWREHTYHKGEEVEMVQWGRAGRAIDRSAWWSSFDIDGALIVKSDNTEIVRIIDEVAPLSSEEETPMADDWKTIEAQAAADLEAVTTDKDAYTFIEKYFSKDLRGRYMAIYRSDRHEMNRTPRQALDSLLSLPPLE